MEKIVYLIEHKINKDELYNFCTSELIPQLQGLGASNINFGVADEAVSAADEKRYLTTASDFNIYLTFFLPTALMLDGWLAEESGKKLSALLKTTSRYDRYVVNESLVLDPTANLENNDDQIRRVSGWMQLALLTKPEKMSRENWLETWLYSHTQIAVETQSTFGYIQNLVQRILPDTRLAIDGVVTEHFPDAAMTSLEAFYAADDDSEKQQENEQAMMESCARFIDFSSINVIPMSAYIVTDTT